MERSVPVCGVLGALALCLVAAAGVAAGPVPAAEGATLGASEGAAVTADESATLAADGTVALQTDRSIELTQEFRLTPDQPGEYEAFHRYDIPSRVTNLNVTFGDRVTVVETRGFEETTAGSYVWDEETLRPTLTLEVAANRTTDDTGPIGTDGDYRFVDVGEWALVVRPEGIHGVQWPSDQPSVGLERTRRVAGEGAVGDAIAFLGPQETYSRSAHGQTINLVVPEDATLAVDRDEIFASLFAASEDLRVGDRDEEVFVVAAPSGSVDWGVRGVQVGDADAWVLDEEGLDEPYNVWLHEYVHTRQDFRADPDAAWLNEAGATYYAARLTLEQERISFGEFRDFLDRGTWDRYSDAVLADPITWRNNPQYDVGALVTGELDRRTRVATDSGASFDTVFARLNEQDGRVSRTDLLGHLQAVGDGGVAGDGDRYATSTERPVPWDATQHGEAFGTTPARFAYAFEADAAEGDSVEGESPFSVSGPYRDRSLAADRPLSVVTGETLSTSVRVTNTGGAEGVYDATPRVDGTPIGRETDRLAPGENTTHTFEWSTEASGTYTLSVGGDQVTVHVREPAEPTVTGFTADRTRIEPGEVVTLSIDVENRAERPAEGTVPVTVNGREVASRSVALDVEEGETVTVEQRFDEPGEYTVGLGDASDRTVTVVVEDPFPTTLVLAGGAVLLLVLLGGALAWWRRRRSRERAVEGYDHREF